MSGSDTETLIHDAAWGVVAPLLDELAAADDLTNAGGPLQ